MDIIIIALFRNSISFYNKITRRNIPSWINNPPVEVKVNIRVEKSAIKKENPKKTRKNIRLVNNNTELICNLNMVIQIYID